jgi:hypothetical protein
VLAFFSRLPPVCGGVCDSRSIRRNREKPGFHWEVDPVRVMRRRFADSIRASSRCGLHQKAGHMTAIDLYAARRIISCQAGAIHT